MRLSQPAICSGDHCRRSRAPSWSGRGSFYRTADRSSLNDSRGPTPGGYSGLQDEVDHHWGELFKAALLSTLLSVAAELGSGAGNGDGSVLQALRRGAGDSLSQTGQQLVRCNLNMQPTLTIRPGFPVRIIANRDLVLEPYRM